MARYTTADNAMPRRILLSVLLLCAVARGATLDQVIAALRSEIRPDDAMAQMRAIYATDRWFTFPKFQETAETLRGAMTKAGLREVEITSVPADGMTQYGYWTMPLAWDVKRATLEIADPTLPASQRMLADYQKIPASLGMWSGPTPPGGVTADLVELKETKREAVAKLDLRGKLVMTSARGLKSALAAAGALGVVNTFTESPALADGRQWINAWGDNGWAYIKGSTPLLSFSISPRQAEYVRSLLARRGSLKVKAMVESRYYNGSYPYVSGLIPGTAGKEEVLLLGHSSEQGAQDNATGVAAMLEAMSAIGRLIESGKLPRPRRGIRLLTMGEMYGSMPYVATHPERIRATVAAMCVDTPAASYDLAGTEYTFYLNPHASASYVDAFMLHLAGAYFPLVRRPWHARPFMTGTDTYLSEPMVGIPTTWGYSGTGVETHHNSEDTPDRVDTRSLRDVATVTAAFVYYLAAAGETDVEWLGQLAATRGYGQILESVTPALEAIATAPDAAHLRQALRDGADRANYATERQQQAVRSAARLAPRLAPVLETLAGSLREFQSAQVRRLRAAANRRGAQLGLAPPVTPADASFDPVAATMVVRRKRFGTIPMDDLPTAQWEGFPSGAWDTRVITALYWCDGKRTLDEVARLTRQELGPDRFDYVAYFRFLARHGYVDIATP
jgi:hypothetical protein